MASFPLIEHLYVEFALEPVNTREHSLHAVDITGINRGILLCETRNNSLENTRNHSQKKRSEPPQPPRLTRTSSSAASADGFEYPTQRRITKR